jgi:hypothetical protein
MKKIFLIILLGLLSSPLFAQTVESAVKRMNTGDYESAKAYWEALSDRKHNYGSQIAICNTCIRLQKEAESLIASERYSKAIEKYQAILSKNPSDQNAKQKIEYCKRLRDEYLAANELQTYTNYAYVYTFKYPAYLNKGTTSTDEKPVFWSSDFNIRVDLSTTLYKNSLTNTQILSKVAESYKGAEVTYKVIKENWIVISGYQANGLTFYEKAIIATRKSQYNEPVKILVSAVVKSPKNDTRGSKIADCISKNLTVNPTGNSVKVTETDDERWQRAKRTDTKEAYINYLAYAPTYSSHKDEATKRKALCEAREDYEKGLYLSAKKNFEVAEQYLTYADKLKYEDSFYRYCINYCNSVEDLQKFTRLFPNHPQIKVIKGCYVKIYCSRGLYSAAKNYVKNNYGVWFNENTPYSKKQWLKYIKDHSKKKVTSKTSTYSTTKPKSNTVSAGMNLYSSGSYGWYSSYKKKSSNVGYTFGVGTELSFPRLYVGAFPQIKVNGGIGDNWNRFNLLADLTIGYSGDFGSTFKAKLAPRWNIIADDFYIYAQPEVGYDFFQGGAVYGGRLGIGLDYLGSVSFGYLYSEGFGDNLWQLSYVYNLYW